MFTGIIEEVGRVKKLARNRDFWIVGINSERVYSQVNVSESISVNGVCLTLVKKESNILFFKVIKPTLEISNLKRLKLYDYVNLESSLKVSDKLGGHFVLGHVDTEAKITRILRMGRIFSLEMSVDKRFKRYLLLRGSIAVEGISLTISSVRNNTFSVNIIPYTWEHTNLRYKKVFSFVNVEFDYLIKAVLKEKANLSS